MNIPTWILDELAHAGPEHLDADYVSQYDQKAGFDPAEDVAALQGLGLKAAHTLVDLGTGTGALALAAAPLCRRVIAVDVSPLMLSRLREKAAQRDIENIEYMQQGFLTYTHQGDPADFVYSRHALHHLPDFWKALALQRVATVLRSGGVLYLRDLVISCELHEISHVIEAWLASASTRPDLGWTRSELETHLREEYSTFSWLFEPMLEQAGFEIQHVKHDVSRVRSTYICIKRKKP